jgi:Ca-activated chloride channel family protein
MSFGRPDLLWLALALPLMVVLAVQGYHRRRQRVAQLMGDPELVQRLAGSLGGGFPFGRAVILMLAAGALGLAVAGPRWGTQVVEGQVAGRDVVLVLDVSRSMLVRDVSPNRLERQRLLARRLVRELEGSRIGLVAFAGRAYILSPLTVDRSALELYLDAMEPEIVSEGGSSLAAAIRQGTDLAGQGRAERGGHRSVILLSDGEAHEDEAAVVAAAARASRAGVVIHTVVVGTAQGGPVPVQDATGQLLDYVRYEGQVVISAANTNLMRRIASETGGQALQVSEPAAATRLVSAVQGGESMAGTSGDRRVQPKDRFRWFAFAAFLLLAWDAVRSAGVAVRPANRQEAS